MNCHHSESPLPGVESQTVIYVSYYSFKGAAMYYLFYCGNEGSVVLYLTILLLIPFRLLKCHNVYNFFWNKFTIVQNMCELSKKEWLRGYLAFHSSGTMTK